MSTNKYTKYIKYSYITACIAVIVYFLPALLNLFMPFLVAFIIAAPFHKIVEFLAAKLHINRSISSIAILSLILLIIGTLLGFAFYYLYNQIKSFIGILPETISQFGETLLILYEKFRGFAPSLAASIDNFLESSNFSLKSYTPQITNSAIGYATDFAASVPSVLFFLLILLLSVFFFIKDYNSIMNFFREAIPEKTLSILRYLKTTAWDGFAGYVKSQLILSSITALLVAVTFWVIGIEYAVVWAIIIGIVDALPILGSGIILIPFSIVLLITQENTVFAIVMLILQAVVFVTRQILSPRVMSSQLGLHPLLTLIGIYVGNKIMGLMGMIVFPILALLLVSFYKSYKDAGSWDNIINDTKKDETQ